MAKTPQKKTSRRDRTIVTHAGNDPESSFGMVNPPIYRTSTVLFPTLRDMNDKGHDKFNHVYYGIYGTPTTFAFEAAVVELEGADRAVALPSGLAACTGAMLPFLKTGDHLLMTDSVYGPTRAFCDRQLTRFGISTTYYDPLIGGDIAKLIQPNTKIVYMESPGSNTFEIQDVPAIVSAAKARGCITILDNTWATPLYFKPFEHGVDLSVHAATKYIAGHSDIMLGIITMREVHYKQVKFQVHGMGMAVSPEDCWLALRGLRTLSVRLAQHQQTGFTLARWLAERPEVERVLHPGLPSHPGHKLWQRDFKGANGLFSIVLKPFSDDRLAAMLDGMRLFGKGFSWGGYESLMIPAELEVARTTTSWVPEGPTLRLSAGLEDPDDLINDLEDGLARLRGN